MRICHLVGNELTSTNVGLAGLARAKRKSGFKEGRERGEFRKEVGKHHYLLRYMFKYLIVLRPAAFNFRPSFCLISFYLYFSSFLLCS